MSAWPNHGPYHLPTITSWSYEALGPTLTSSQHYLSGTTSAVWPAANRALFVPVRIVRPITVRQLWCLNGAAVSGNVDVALYDHAGNRIVSSGSVAQAGVSDLQAFDVTDTVIGPGLYYMALALDNGVGTILRLATLQTARGSGMAQMASAFPLPTVATFAAIAASYVPTFGLCQRAVI